MAEEELGRAILAAIQRTRPRPPSSALARPWWRLLGGPPTPVPLIGGHQYAAAGTMLCPLECGHVVMWEEEDARAGGPVFCGPCYDAEGGSARAPLAGLVATLEPSS